MKAETKKEILRTIKYTLIAMSAGIIQFGLTALFNGIHLNNGLSYFIALVASVIWNFTINRKYTFKSANNVPKAMLLVFLYYLVFTPLSLLFVAYLGDGIIIAEDVYVIKNFLGWHWLIGFAINIFINFVTEFLFQKFVVFRNSIDTNDLAKKENENVEQEEIEK